MVALLVGALCVEVLPGCRPAEHGEVHEVVPELKLEQVKFRVWRGADLRVEGEARVARLRRDTTRLEADDLVAVLPRAAGQVEIRAPHGSGLLSSRVFSADGGVTVERGTDVARTPSARYEAAGEGIVSGDEELTVDGRGYRLQGTGFTFYPASGDLVVRGKPRLVAGLGESR